MASSRKETFTKEERIQRTFLRVARVLHEVWEEGWGHTRLLDEPMIPTHLVEVGRSLAGTDHREHVVPLLAIYNRCEEMFAAGQSLAEVSEFLRKHVMIVWISKTEQQRIDHQLGLKSKMPEGWSFDDDGADVFARLRLGGVAWQ